MKKMRINWLKPYDYIENKEMPTICQIYGCRNKLKPPYLYIVHQFPMKAATVIWLCGDCHEQVQGTVPAGKVAS